MLLISAWLLPESLDYLLAKRPKQALERINATVNRMGLNELPVMPRYEKSARKMAVSWANYLLDNLDFKRFVCGLHSFSDVWLLLCHELDTKILISMGMSPEQGVSTGILISIGGIFGQPLLVYWHHV